MSRPRGGHGQAVADPHDPVGHGREQRLVVTVQGDRQPGLAGEPEQVDDLGGGGDVEAGGRLVGDDERRAGDQSPGDGNPLALPEGELARQAVRVQLAEPELGK